MKKKELSSQRAWVKNHPKRKEIQRHIFHTKNTKLKLPCYLCEVRNNCECPCPYCDCNRPHPNSVDLKQDRLKEKDFELAKKSAREEPI